MSSTPGFAATPKAYGASTGTASTSRTTPTAYAELVPVTANNVSLSGVQIKARSTTAAGLVFFFLFDGSTYYLAHEQAVSAVSPTGTVAAFEDQYVPDLPIQVPAGWALRISIYDATSTIVFTGINAGQY